MADNASYAYAFVPSSAATDSGTPVLTASQLQGVKKFLEQCLPASIVLLRRLQLVTPTESSLLLSSSPLLDDETGDAYSAWSRPFLVGFFDRSNTPGVHGWLFGSLDAHNLNATAAADATLTAGCVHSFFKKLVASPYATVSSALTDQLVDDSEHFLLGAVTEPVRNAMLADTHLARMMCDDVYGTGGPYVKLVFSTAGLAERLAAAKLPINLEWSTVGEADFELVMANNDILRSAEMIRALPNACIREQSTGQMVAWGFSGPDGSVRSLTCLADWRGRGLARLVVLKLHSQAPLKALPGSFGHGDTAESNIGSMALFRSLQAERVSSCYWIRLDLRQVTE